MKRKLNTRSNNGFGSRLITQSRLGSHHRAHSLFLREARKESQAVAMAPA